MTDVPQTQARYQVRLYNTSGVLQAIFDDWRTLELQRRLNTYDVLTMGIDGADSRKSLFTLDSIIEVWRRIESSTYYPWYREGVCLHRTPSRQITERGTRIFTSYARGLIDLLRRREILYFANTPFTLKGDVSETVMKQFVDENAGPSANNAARLASGVTSGLTVEASARQGKAWAGARAWQNLLDVVQEISTFGSVDFDVVRTDAGGPVALEFRTYYPRLGTDRSTTVQFASQFGNMLNPFYTKSRTEEITRVAVLGSGSDTNRRVITRDGSTQGDSPWNIIEKSQDSSQESTLTGLQAAGDAVLAAAGPQTSFTFEVLQTSSLQYGRDYFLGDLITAAFDTDISETKKITGVTMNVSEGKEIIQITFSDVPVFA